MDRGAWQATWGRKESDMTEQLRHFFKGMNSGHSHKSNSLQVLEAQMVKHLPTMWETQVQSLGQEDSLEKGMATHSTMLAWRILWTEEPGGLQSMGPQSIGHD